MNEAMRSLSKKAFSVRESETGGILMVKHVLVLAIIILILTSASAISQGMAQLVYGFGEYAYVGFWKQGVSEQVAWTPKEACENPTENRPIRCVELMSSGAIKNLVNSSVNAANANIKAQLYQQLNQLSHMTNRNMARVRTEKAGSQCQNGRIRD